MKHQGKVGNNLRQKEVDTLLPQGNICSKSGYIASTVWKEMEMKRSRQRKRTKKDENGAKILLRYSLAMA